MFVLKTGCMKYAEIAGVFGFAFASPGTGTRANELELPVELHAAHGSIASRKRSFTFLKGINK